MSYYGTGDYYLAGDPGLFSSIGSFLKGGVQIGLGALTGGVGGAISAGRQVFSPRPGAVAAPRPMRIASPQALPQMIPPSARMLMGPSRGIPVGPQSMDGIAPRGYHLNKSGYFLKSGQYVPPRSRYVRNRTRNFANGKALNRAISRTAGFNRLVKRSRKNLRALSKI